MELGGDERRQRREGEQLPDEVLSNIISYFPTKTLVALKCESKWFKHLIHGDWFCKLREKNVTQQKLLLCTDTDNDNGEGFFGFDFHHFDDVDYEIEDDELVTLKTYATHPLIASWLKTLDEMDEDEAYLGGYDFNGLNDTIFLGSAKGLVCIKVNESGFIVWNPCIRQALEFPLPPPSYIHPLIFGFGYNSHNQDFEIVAVGVLGPSPALLEGDYITLGAVVFSTSHCEWRTEPSSVVIKNRPLMPVRNGSMVCNTLVWSYCDDVECTPIHGFSLDSHSFLLVVGLPPLPHLYCEGSNQKVNLKWNLSVLSEFLWAWSSFQGENHFWKLSDLTTNGLWQPVFDFEFAADGEDVTVVLGASRLLHRLLLLGGSEDLYLVGVDDGTTSYGVVDDTPVDSEERMEFLTTSAIPFEETTFWPFTLGEHLC